MKIGIITFSRIYNYGSALQTYALNKYLTGLGHQVKTIDYAQPMQEKNKNKLFEANKGLMSFVRNIQVAFYKRQILMGRKKFDDFYREYVPKTKTYDDKQQMGELENELDMFICGSDQIWNTNYFGFDTSYLLSFVKDKTKCISYAASIGVSKINEEDEKIFKQHLSDFKKVLVREKKAAQLLDGCIGTQPDVVLDPVFLVDKKDWENIASQPILKKPYALCYFIGNISGMREKALELGRKCGLPLVVVRLNLRDWLGRYKRMYDKGPREFLGLIKNADCVFTNSFHAVAFSIIFRKNFWAFSQNESEASQSRIDNILEKTHLNDRKVYINSQNTIWNKPIDFSEAEQALNSEIEYSKKMLKDSLGG